MTRTLKDVLREHSARHGAQDEKNRAMIDEWRSAVEELFAQLREWLKSSDPDGILRIEQTDRSYAVGSKIVVLNPEGVG